MKRYFLKEIANVVAGLDRGGIGGDEDVDGDDRFKYVKVPETDIIDSNSQQVMRSRLHDIVKAHRNRHTNLNNAKDPIRSMFNEEAQLTKKDLDTVEKYADNLFHTLGVDITFTKHFLDRANDSRNGKQITVQELISLFNKQYTVNGVKIRKMRTDTEAVLKDLKSDINSPVYFEWDQKTKMLEMRLKTTMRKKNFHSPDPILKA